MFHEQIKGVYMLRILEPLTLKGLAAKASGTRGLGTSMEAVWERISDGRKAMTNESSRAKKVKLRGVGLLSLASGIRGTVVAFFHVHNILPVGFQIEN